MTEGSNQGLFVIVAVIIFGIFVLISYLLFSDDLKSGLGSIFEDSLDQAIKDLTGEEDEDLIDAEINREYGDYVFSRLREGDKVNSSDIWVRAIKLKDGTLHIEGASYENFSFDEGRGVVGGDFIMPDSIGGMKITSIANSAFSSAKITGELRLPKGLKNLGAYAFANSKLTGELVLPKGIKTLEDCVFYKANFSGKLVLPEGLTSIGVESLTYSVFTESIELPKGLTRVGKSALQESKFTGEFELPESLKYIGSDSFSRSKFTGTMDVSKVSVIQGSAFSSSRINKVIRGNVEIIYTLDANNEYGINSNSIKLASGVYYNGSNDY